jgi:hypothetical protein
MRTWLPGVSSAWRKVPPSVRWSAVAVVGALGAVAILRWYVGPLAWSVGGRTVQELAGKDRADALNSVRQILLAGAAGLIALGGLAFTARNFYLSRRGQMTDRYAAAIALLASEKIAERVGGVFALEHVLQESSRDHVTVIDVLTAFVRDRVPVAESEQINSGDSDGLTRSRHPSADVQAALTVIGRRPRRSEPYELNLRRTDLAGANLVDARLDGAALSECDLRGAYLTGAQLNGAAIWNTALQGAYMRGTELLNADLRGSDLRGAAVDGARLGGFWSLTRGQIMATTWDPESPPEVDEEYKAWIAEADLLHGGESL